MADLVARLKVDSSEYDAKIKRAAQGLQHFVQYQHEAGDVIGRLVGNTRKYVESLGSMETVSKTARGRVAELTSAFTDLRAVYNSLSDEEKNTKGGFGETLNKQLEILKGRINDAKSELQSIDQELGNTKQSEDKTAGGLEGLTSALGINITKLAGWGAALGAAKGALEVAKDAFFASEQNLDDWDRMVYSAQSTYEGFLTALNTGDVSGFLGRINQIVKAASEAYDALDALSTQKALNNPAIQVQQAENARMQAMIRTKRYIAPLDGRPAAMQNGQLLTNAQLKALERHLENGMKTLNTYIKKEVAATTRAIEALYNEQAQRLGMSRKEFLEGTANYDVFKDRLDKAKKYYEFESEHTKTLTQTTSSGVAYTTRLRDEAVNPYTAYKNWNVFRDDGELFKKINELIDQRAAAMTQSFSQQAGTYKSINRLEGIKPGFEKETDKDKAQKAVNDALLNYQQAIDKAALELKSGAITEADVKKKNLSAQEALYDAYGKAYATYADPKYKEAQEKAATEIIKLGGEVKNTSEAQEAQKKAARELEQAQKKAAEEEKKRALMVARWSTASTGSIESLKKDLQKRQSTTAVGSAEFNALQTNIVDISSLQTLINAALKSGLTIDPEIPNMLMQQIVGGKDIDNRVWEELQKQLNERLKEMNLDPLELDFNTGEGKSSKKSTLTEDSKKVIGGLSSVASGLQQMGVELPQEVQQVIGVIQGAMTILEGINTVIGVTQTTALTANTAALFALTSALWANTGMQILPFAGGGIVPHFADGGLIGRAASGMLVGNNMSGDNLRMPVVGGGMIGINDGELILNKAQQGVIANDLVNGGMGGLHMTLRASGENLIAAIEATGKRKGYGELCWWR